MRARLSSLLTVFGTPRPRARVSALENYLYSLLQSMKNHASRKTWPRVCAALALVLLSAAASAEVRPQLRADDRVRLAEAFRMADHLGERVWEGWSKAPFAVLLVTPEYEFLVRHPRPSGDFERLGYDALLKSDVYFRKRVFQTNLLATFPAVGGVSTIVIGQPENTQAGTSTRWVVTLLHEHFHQMQDSQPNFYEEVKRLNLARGDETGMWMLDFAFPYERPEVAQKFSAAARALAAALNARKGRDFGNKLAAYLAARKNLRDALAADDYKYLSFQLWKEGVARYTEYRVALDAAARYTPTKEFASLKDFTPFAEDAARSLALVMSDLEQMSLAERKRIAFYPFGAGEALLLDRARPGWRRRYFVEKFSLAQFFAR